jgi:hypothetical protein
MTYIKWTPPLHSDELTLAEVYATLHANKQNQINFWVWLLENPQSKVHLSGAVDLFNHDCLHIVLARGLAPSDEAFVIGCTMGSVPTLKTWEIKLYKFFAHFIYPKVYRFNKTQLHIFEQALLATKKAGIQDLSHYDFHTNFNKKLGDIRQELGISKIIQP